MIRRLAVLLVAGAAVGAAAGWALSALLDETYEATATLHVLPAAENAVAPDGELAAEVQAASYARLVGRRGFLEQIQGQVAGGRLTVAELARRVSGRHADGTALAEVVAEGETRQRARGLAADVAGAVVAYARETARQRAAQVEDELRRRIEDVTGQIEEAAGDAPRLDALREERERLNERLAQLSTDAIDEGTRLVLAGAASAGPEPTRPRPVLFGAVGAALGLLVAIVVLLVSAGPRRRPDGGGPALLEPAPAPSLLEPRAGAVVSGAVPLRVEPEGAHVDLSPDGAGWQPLPAAGGRWETAEIPDGRYLLRVRGSEGAVPVVVDNTPPDVGPVEARPQNGRYRLSAEARDDGSGVAALVFMVSRGAPDWQEVPAEWEPPEPGLYWLSAVAADRAGHRAASDPVPLRTGSL